MPKPVKVTGLVDRVTHSKLDKLARELQTTVGAIVTFGTHQAVKMLTADKRIARQLQPDKRYK